VVQLPPFGDMKMVDICDSCSSEAMCATPSTIGTTNSPH